MTDHEHRTWAVTIMFSAKKRMRTGAEECAAEARQYCSHTFIPILNMSGFKICTVSQQAAAVDMPAADSFGWILQRD